MYLINILQISIIHSFYTFKWFQLLQCYSTVQLVSQLQETNIAIVLHVNIMYTLSFSIFKSLMMAFYKGCNTSHSVIQYCTTTNTAVTDRSLLSTVPPLFLQRLSIKISTTASSSIKYASLKPLPSFRSKFPHAVPKVKSITTFNSVL